MRAAVARRASGLRHRRSRNRTVPASSRDMVRHVLRQMRAEGHVQVEGRGPVRSGAWSRLGEEPPRATQVSSSRHWVAVPLEIGTQGRGETSTPRRRFEFTRTAREWCGAPGASSRGVATTFRDRPSPRARNDVVPARVDRGNVPSSHRRVPYVRQRRSWRCARALIATPIMELGIGILERRFTRLGCKGSARCVSLPFSRSCRSPSGALTGRRASR